MGLSVLKTEGKIKEILEKVKEQYQKITPKMRKLMIGIAILVMVVSVGLAVLLNNKPYETLFTGLNAEEATEVMGKLQELGVDYKYNKSGGISVPKEQEEQTRAQLAYAGYPKSGFNYGVFKDNIGMTTTDFEKNNYKIFELETRMGSTIRLFQGVKDAKVAIAAVEDKKYVLDKNSEKKAEASVVVIMKDGGSPTQDQVKGIQRLVAKSIPDMKIEDVAVIDGNGNDVTGTTGDGTTEGANKLKLEFEKHMDDTIRAKILSVLSPIYGDENVKVSVRTTVDVDKKIREIINHQIPVEGSEKGIPSSEKIETEVVKDGKKAGGVPGTETNADIPTYSQITTDGTESYLRNENTIEYLVNQLKEQSTIDSGSIEDMTVSVTINGENTGTLSKAEVLALVGNTAGIEKDLQREKVTVVAAPFYQQKSAEVPKTNNNWIIIGAIATGVVLLISVILLLVFMKKKKKKKDMALSQNMDRQGLSNNIKTEKLSKMEQERLLKETLARQQEDRENQILNLTNDRAMDLKQKVRDISEESPEIAAQMIKLWLKGGE